jgi:hypothetical protein
MFYQICKIFLFPKISVKFMKSLYASLGLEVPKLPILTSNVYSQPEILMLGFVNALLDEK